MARRPYYYIIMRKFFAIATFIGVGVLSLFGMSRVAYGATICEGISDKTGRQSIYAPYPASAYVDKVQDGFLCATGSLAGVTSKSFDVVHYDPSGTDIYMVVNGVEYVFPVEKGLNHIILDISWGSATSTTFSYSSGNSVYSMGGVTVSSGSSRYPYRIGTGAPALVFYDDEDGDLSWWNTYWASTTIQYDNSVNLNDNSSTRFISFDPGMGNRYSTTTPTASSSLTFYLNNDVEDSEELRMRYSLYRQGRDGIRRLIDGGNDTTWDFFQGIGQYGESTVYFPNLFDYSLEGVYYWSVDMCRPSFWSWSGCKSVVASSTYFIVGDVTGYELAQGEAGQEAYDSYASTTLALARSCNPLAEFSFSTCLKLMIVPSPSILVSRVSDVLAIPPWGYIYRLYEIFAFDTASSSLPVISATIPSGILGAGSSISLDANHALDFVLNATTSQFLNSSASSTETFFEFTNRYWSVLVYLGFGFYVLSRIIGIRRVNIK